jgi:hypothetical protein
LKILDVPNKSLVTDTIYNGIFLISRETVPNDGSVNVVEYCKEKCLESGICKSLEIRVDPSTQESTCYFNNADVKQIEEITEGQNTLVDDPNSNVYVVHCKCKDPEVEVLEKCQCTETLINGDQLCHSVLQMTYYEPQYTGECKAVVVQEFGTCGGVCEDVDDPETCSQHRNSQECHEPEVRDACKRTCGYCECSGTKEEKTDCVDNKQTVITITYHEAVRGYCTFDQTIEVKPCVPECKTGEYKTVGPCVNGERVIDISVVTRVNGQCLTDRSTQTEDCAGCCPSVKLVPQRECSNGYRQVSREWWSRVGDCCRQQRFISEQKCDGCDADVSLSLGECSLGFRATYTIWEENVNDHCEEHVDADLNAC